MRLLLVTFALTSVSAGAVVRSPSRTDYPAVFYTPVQRVVDLVDPTVEPDLGNFVYEQVSLSSGVINEASIEVDSVAGLSGGIFFESLTPEIATVDESGYVTYVADGTAEIKISFLYGDQDATVIEIPVSSTIEEVRVASGFIEGTLGAYLNRSREIFESSADFNTSGEVEFFTSSPSTWASPSANLSENVNAALSAGLFTADAVWESGSKTGRRSVTLVSPRFAVGCAHSGPYTPGPLSTVHFYNGVSQTSSTVQSRVTSPAYTLSNFYPDISLVFFDADSLGTPTLVAPSEFFAGYLPELPQNTEDRIAGLYINQHGNLKYGRLYEAFDRFPYFETIHGAVAEGGIDLWDTTDIVTGDSGSGIYTIVDGAPVLIAVTANGGPGWVNGANIPGFYDSLSEWVQDSVASYATDGVWPVTNEGGYALKSPVLSGFPSLASGSFVYVADTGTDGATTRAAGTLQGIYTEVGVSSGKPLYVRKELPDETSRPSLAFDGTVWAFIPQTLSGEIWVSSLTPYPFAYSGVGDSAASKVDWTGTGLDVADPASELDQDLIYQFTVTGAGSSGGVDFDGIYKGTVSAAYQYYVKVGRPDTRIYKTGNKWAFRDTALNGPGLDYSTCVDSTLEYPWLAAGWTVGTPVFSNFRSD